MKARSTALLMTSLACLILSGQALATPRFPDGDWLAAREERDYGNRKERETRNDKKQEGRKADEKANEKDREQGFGYGYERRSSRPQYDDRGRR